MRFAITTLTAILALASAPFSLAAPSPPGTGICALCPKAVNSTTSAVTEDGSVTTTTSKYWLVNKSNSGYGTPTYCGFNRDSSHPWPEVFCFYAPSGEFFSSSDGFKGCPTNSTTGPC